jgi:two-component system chemotaxis response regulator CheY
MLKQDAKILIADDSSIIRKAMTRIFNELGYTNVVLAEDGAQAVERHAAEKPDLILLDIVMPNMNGDEALAKIRDADKATPVIMLSSVAKQSQIDACKALGIIEFVVKPLTAEDGKTVIKALLDRL